MGQIVKLFQSRPYYTLACNLIKENHNWIRGVIFFSLGLGTLLIHSTLSWSVKVHSIFQFED